MLLKCHILVGKMVLCPERLVTGGWLRQLSTPPGSRFTKESVNLRLKEAVDHWSDTKYQQYLLRAEAALRVAGCLRKVKKQPAAAELPPRLSTIGFSFWGHGRCEFAKYCTKEDLELIYNEDLAVDQECAAAIFRVMLGHDFSRNDEWLKKEIEHGNAPPTLSTDMYQQLKCVKVVSILPILVSEYNNALDFCGQDSSPEAIVSMASLYVLWAGEAVPKYEMTVSAQGLRAVQNELAHTRRAIDRDTRNKIIAEY